MGGAESVYARILPPVVPRVFRHSDVARRSLLRRGFRDLLRWTEELHILPTRASLHFPRSPAPPPAPGRQTEYHRSSAPPDSNPPIIARRAPATDCYWPFRTKLRPLRFYDSIRTTPSPNLFPLSLRIFRARFLRESLRFKRLRQRHYCSIDVVDDPRL
jgi:hypothetical protein